jgi:hypothetical protein
VVALFGGIRGGRIRGAIAPSAIRWIVLGGWAHRSSGAAIPRRDQKNTFVCLQWSFRTKGSAMPHATPKRDGRHVLTADDRRKALRARREMRPADKVLWALRTARTNARYRDAATGVGPSNPHGPNDHGEHK